MAAISGSRFYFLVALLLIALSATSFAAARSNKVILVDQVEYLVSDSVFPPDDDAAWLPATLPDNWAVTRPGFKGQVWYRFRFFIPGDHPVSRSVYIPRNTSTLYMVFINGKRRGGSRAYVDPNLTDLHRPLIHGTAGLPPGENTVHIRVTGDAQYRHGLTRVVVGPPRILRPQYFESRYDLQVTSVAAFGATLLLAGLLALLVWRGEKEKPVLFWFGMASLSWAICSFLMIWPPQVKTGAVQHLLLYSVRHFYAVPLLILYLRVVNVRQPWLESILWSLFVVGAAIAMLLDADDYVPFASITWVIYFILILGFFVWLLWMQIQTRSQPEMRRNSDDTGSMRFRARERSAYFLPLMLLVVIGFMAHDWGRWMGFIDYDNLLLAPFAMPFMILALGATIIDRHLQTARALSRSNVELEKRVAEKARELERAYSQMHITEREQAVMRERQRLMGDMHDGLTANLVSLHNLVQAKKADAGEVARRLDDTLRELRAIIDSLEPVEGDLGVVLGNVRYRMRAALEESGARLRWQVEELPVMPDLTPDKILNIQRILLEVLTNTLRHAHANTVTVSAAADNSRNLINIIITDDGKGFNQTIPQGGRGLRNMRDRAARAGFALDIHSAPGQGTTVALKIPIGHT